MNWVRGLARLHPALQRCRFSGTCKLVDRVRRWTAIMFVAAPFRLLASAKVDIFTGSVVSSGTQGRPGYRPLGDPSSNPAAGMAEGLRGLEQRA